MRDALHSPQSPETMRTSPEIRLLIARESWLRVFLQNLREFFRRSAPSSLDPQFAPADFWLDVFVNRGLPWQRFLQSGALHILTLASLWAISHFLVLQPHPVPQPRFTHADVIYYSPSEYLPPLDTRRKSSEPVQSADPEFSLQPIISLPPHPDNHTQTIVTPPKVVLAHDVAGPNIVALTENYDRRMPIAPAPAVPVSEIARLPPQMQRDVVAPPPIVE